MDLPRLERASPEGLSQHRGCPDGRVDRAAVGRGGVEEVRGVMSRWGLSHYNCCPLFGAGIVRSEKRVGSQIIRSEKRVEQ